VSAVAAKYVIRSPACPSTIVAVFGDVVVVHDDTS
jgi:hypothetical protein